MKIEQVLSKLLGISVEINKKSIVFIWDLRLRASKKNSYIRSNIALVPYGSLDCELQYMIIEKFLNRNIDDKYEVNYIKPFKIKSKSTHTAVGPLLTYQEKLEYIHTILGDRNFDIIRGAYDEYRKDCIVSELFEKSTIDTSLIDKIQYQIDLAKEIVDGNTTIVIPDIAYTKSRSIKHFSKERNKKVLVINPYGEVRDISSNEALDPDPSAAEIHGMRLLFHKDFDIEDAATSYVKRRIAGDIVQDLDAVRAFNKREREKLLDFTNKKVLLLHCIADAANVPMQIRNSDDLILNDYFLWTREMFRIVSKEPGQWLIKIHPASKLYPKDYQIINRLMVLFQIPTDAMIPEGCSTLEVLQSKAPIFTHSGTIALESAALGQRAVCITGRYGDEIALNVRSIKALENLAEKSAESLQEILKNSSENSVLAATWLFLWRSNYEHGRVISVKHPIQPNMGALHYLLTQHKICVDFYKKVLSRKFYSDFSMLIQPYFVD